MAEGLSAHRSDKDEQTIRVALADRSYDIVIGEGILAEAAARIDAILPGSACAIVSDENVAPLYLDPVKHALREQGLFRGEVVVAPGEASKCFATLETACETLLEMGLERGDCVIALGGGVVGDLAGFAASILRRGVALVQIPTSLLAQVDSSVGGKTGIDTPQGKNLIGTFHQPGLVLIDIGVLATLPERELKAGYAEIAKYGLLGDAAFFAWLERNWQKIVAGDAAARRHAIAVSCEAKAAIVAADEREESGRRALLNLGHTFGHALEAYSGYSDRLLHGEAIAIGMALAFALSSELGLCDAADADRVRAHFRAVGLPTSLSEMEGGAPTAFEMLHLMAQDKKVKAGKLNLVLARGIGAAYVDGDVPMETLTGFLQRECSG